MTFFTGDKVSKADGGEGDDDEVDGLECAPALDVLEDDGWQGHEDEAPEQGEEQGGEDADLRLADFPLLWGDELLIRRIEDFHIHKIKLLMKPVGMRRERFEEMKHSEQGN